MARFVPKSWLRKQVVQAEDVNRWEQGIATLDVDVNALKAKVSKIDVLATDPVNPEVGQIWIINGGNL